jgi:hypothetical protein
VADWRARCAGILLVAGVLAACATAGGIAFAPRIAVAESIDADGTLIGEAAIFDRETTRQVLVVVAAKGLREGTLLSYVRYLDGKYIDDRSARLADPERVFAFRYAARPDRLLVAGHYLYKIYLNKRFAGMVEFEIR